MTDDRPSIEDEAMAAYWTPSTTYKPDDVVTRRLAWRPWRWGKRRLRHYRLTVTP